MSTVMSSPSSSSDSTTSRSSCSDSSSFCLSTAYTDFIDQTDFSKPTRFSGEPIPGIAVHTDKRLEPDKTIYSFAWSSISSDHFELEGPIRSFHPMASTQQVPGNNAALQGETEDRCEVPSLPRPVFWSAVSNPKTFKDYIQTKQLIPPDRTILPATGTTARTHQSEAIGMPYANMKTIVKANTSSARVSRDDRPTDTWINDHFRDSRLPAPFIQDRLTERNTKYSAKAKLLWCKSPDGRDRNKDNFATLPNLLSEAETARWLMHYSRSIGKLYRTLNNQ